MLNLCKFILLLDNTFSQFLCLESDWELSRLRGMCLILFKSVIAPIQHDLSAIGSQSLLVNVFLIIAWKLEYATYIIA